MMDVRALSPEERAEFIEAARLRYEATVARVRSTPRPEIAAYRELRESWTRERASGR